MLGASDAEWQILGPKVEKILTLQRERERFIGKPKLPKPPERDEADHATTQKAAALPVMDIKSKSKGNSTAAARCRSCCCATRRR